MKNFKSLDLTHKVNLLRLWRGKGIFIEYTRKDSIQIDYKSNLKKEIASSKVIKIMDQLIRG